MKSRDTRNLWDTKPIVRHYPSYGADRRGQRGWDVLT
jgi:hypothetical protein